MILALATILLLGSVGFEIRGQEAEYAGALRGSGSDAVARTLERLSAVVRAYPAFARGYYRIISIAGADGQLELAREVLERLPDHPDTRPYIDYGWSVYFNHREDWVRAEDHARRSAAARPGFSPAYSEWINAARGQGRLKELRSSLQIMAGKDATNEGARYGLALVALESRDADEATRQLAQVTTASLDSIEYLDLAYHCRTMKRDYRGALVVLDRILALAQQRGDVEWVGYALGRMGLANNELGEVLPARDQLERCVAIARELGNRVTERIYLTNLGLAEYYLGNYSTALVHYRTALSLIPLSSNRRSAGRIVGLIAAAHAKTGDYSRAIAGHRESAAISASVKDRGSEADQTASLADIYLAAGDTRLALESIETALVIARQMKNPWLEGRFVQVLGAVHAEGGRFGEARAAYRAAVRLTASVGDQIGEARALIRTGEMEQRLGRPTPARDSYTAALELGTRTGSSTIAARAHAGLGEALRRLGLHDHAEKNFRTALGLGTRTAGPEVVFQANVGLARLARTRANSALATEHYRTALDAAEQVRSTLVSPEFKAGYLARKLDVFKEFTSYLMTLDRRQPGSGRREEAFAVAERGRARSWLDLMAESHVESRTGLPQPGRQRELQAKLSRLRAELVSATVLSRPDQSAVNRLRAAILQADDEYQMSLWERRRQLREERDIRDPRPATITELQESLQPGAIVLEYSLADAGSTLFAITREKFQAFRLPAQKVITDEVTALRRILASRPNRLAQGRLLLLSSALFQKLVAPSQPMMRGKRELIVIPDGALHYLPFELLAMSQEKSDAMAALPFLVTRHAISYAPSASVLLALTANEKQDRQRSRILLAYGDPQYTTGGERKESPAPAWRSAGSWPFRNLPESRREVEQLRTLYGREGAVVRMGREATEESIKADGDLPGYRYVHFATHGVLNDSKPHLSGLALTLPGQAEAAEDGILYAYEVFNLKFNADVVALSACETALGTDVTGEGLIGLNQAFLYAGASAVISALWKVDDRAAAELMIRFHSNLAKDPQNLGDALRRAKLEMIRSSTWAHPHYWSGLTLTGSSRFRPVEHVAGDSPLRR